MLYLYCANFRKFILTNFYTSLLVKLNKLLVVWLTLEKIENSNLLHSHNLCEVEMFKTKCLLPGIGRYREFNVSLRKTRKLLSKLTLSKDGID